MNVVIVDDSKRYRNSLESLIELTPALSHAESFESADQALAVVDSARAGRVAWDLILMDIQMPGTNGIEATRRLKQLLPDTRIVMLTVYEDSDRILEAICAGADGYLLKKSSPDELLSQLELVTSGGAPLTAGVARSVLGLLRDADPKPQCGLREYPPLEIELTEREREVLGGLVQGLAYKQVAAELEVSIDTVRTHVKAIYGKLQVHSVAAAVGRAIREDMV